MCCSLNYINMHEFFGPVSLCRWDTGASRQVKAVSAVIVTVQAQPPRSVTHGQANVTVGWGSQVRHVTSVRGTTTVSQNGDVNVSQSQHIRSGFLHDRAHEYQAKAESHLFA